MAVCGIHNCQTYLICSWPTTWLRQPSPSWMDMNGNLWSLVVSELLSQWDCDELCGRIIFRLNGNKHILVPCHSGHSREFIGPGSMSVDSSMAYPLVTSPSNDWTSLTTAFVYSWFSYWTYLETVVEKKPSHIWLQGKSSFKLRPRWDNHHQLAPFRWGSSRPEEHSLQAGW
jgi:hypothetical protein